MDTVMFSIAFHHYSRGVTQVIDMFSVAIKPIQEVNLMGKESSHNLHIYLKALGKNLKQHTKLLQTWKRCV